MVMIAIYIGALLLGACNGQVIPNKAVRDDFELPSLPTLEQEETSYSYTPSVDTGAENPYIHRSRLPTNLVFIIVGSILVLLLLISLAYWVSTWMVSIYNAKVHSEKYYYNSPFHFNLGDSSTTTTTSSTSSLFEKKSSISNFSQLTMNQPLNPARPYRNATMDNNRGSMFFSPTNDLLIASVANGSSNNSDTISGYNQELNSSSLSFIDMSAELGNYDTLQLNTDETDPVDPKPKLTRPPSQYLDDLLDD